MTALLGRAAASAGWLAHAIGRLLGAIAWFAPRRIPWALPVAALLAFGAWSAIDAGRAVAARQPTPRPAALAEVVASRASGWVGTSALVRGPFLDSSSYGAPVQRWYYLLLDPIDPEVAMIARSAERLEERRSRTITARVTTDPAAVQAALARFGGGPREVDADRYLVELPDRPGRLTGDEIASPAGRGLDRERVILRGSFDHARPAASGEGWEYLVSDGGRTVVVRSPFPPDELPVDVWGVATTDRVRVSQAAAVPELRAELDGRRIPQRRLFAEGVTPPLAEVSYLPAMLLAAMAAIVATGWLIGYPLFLRRPTGERITTWPLRPGDELLVDLFGTDRRGPEPIVVDSAPARLALLAPGEMERRSWQFAVGGPSRPAHAVPADPATDLGGLALASGEGPILVLLDPPPYGLRLATGNVVHVSGTRAGLRIRTETLDLVAAFPSVADRDRALAAIDPSRRGEVRPGGSPGSRAAIGRQAPPDGLPVPLQSAAAVLVGVGAILTLGGAFGMTAAADPSPLVPSLAQIVAGFALMAVGRGVWLRRTWAEGIGFTVGWVGCAIAAFLVVAAPQCGLWLAPNLAACRAIGPAGSAAALGAAIGLGYAALAIRRHASAFVR